MVEITIHAASVTAIGNEDITPDCHYSIVTAVVTDRLGDATVLKIFGLPGRLAEMEALAKAFEAAFAPHATA